MANVALAIFDLDQETVRAATAEEIQDLGLSPEVICDTPKDRPRPRYIAGYAPYSYGPTIKNADLNITMPEVIPAKGVRVASINIIPLQVGDSGMVGIAPIGISGVTFSGIIVQLKVSVQVVAGLNVNAYGVVSVVLEIWE